MKKNLKVTSSNEVVVVNKRFQTAYNRENFRNKKDYETITRPSMTIPNEALSVPDIIRRYAQGLPPVGARTPIYEGEDSPFAGIDINRMDLVERHNLLEEVKRNIREQQTRRMEELKQKQQAAYKKQVDEGVKQALKEMETKKSTGAKEEPPVR